ncbi:MAG: DUF6883 domain-containing protein [Pirellulaceae bacterium]
MLLPHVDQAIVAVEKLTDYLLCKQHPTGKHKARFFRGLGFSLEEPELFRTCLLNHARSNLVVIEEVTPFGIKYVIDGAIVAPNGSSPRVRVVWIVESGTQSPRLVTAFPHD